jgi:hypothetical protein
MKQQIPRVMGKRFVHFAQEKVILLGLASMCCSDKWVVVDGVEGWLFLH